jgi:hypothetical protein
MFPHTFVQNYLFALTRAGDVILDPLSGRGSTLLESLLLDRKALAVDINPVAACVTGAISRLRANAPRPILRPRALPWPTRSCYHRERARSGWHRHQPQAISMAIARMWRFPAVALPPSWQDCPR